MKYLSIFFASGLVSEFQDFRVFAFADFADGAWQKKRIMFCLILLLCQSFGWKGITFPTRFDLNRER